MWLEGCGDLPGQLFVVSGPSGCGKSSVIRAALASGRLAADLSVSATTRSPRRGESQGLDYYFLSPEEFEFLRGSGGLLESAEYNENRYGTPAQPVFEALGRGRSMILEIEVVGAKQVRDRAPSAFFVFIKTPSFRVLEARLRARGTDSDEAVHRRLCKGREELAEAHWYDQVLINDSFDRCVGEFIDVLRSNGCGG
jgi:guanylate kinase